MSRNPSHIELTPVHPPGSTLPVETELFNIEEIYRVRRNHHGPGNTMIYLERHGALPVAEVFEDVRSLLGVR